MSQKSLSGRQGLLLLVVVLLAALAFLFRKGFEADQALFANDGPLGVLKADYYKAPDGFFGVWDNIHWVGMYGGNFPPSPTYMLLWALGPLGFAKFYAPLTAVLLGICAWIFFRRMGCNARSAILGGIAAALNMNFFSNAAWGLGTRGLSLGATFLALAALETGAVVQPILTSILAGAAIGLSIIEGGDNGGIFSMFVGAYAFWRTWVSIPARGKAVSWGIGKVVIMAAFAGIMASQTLGIFVRTAVKGVTNVEQETAGQRWDFATQWSLPKLETLRLIIPGLFGYRLDTADGGAYWGAVGQYPKIPEIKSHANDPDPQARQQAMSILSRSDVWRSSGAGEYAGVIVVLIGIWALVESLRAKSQTFSALERKLIWFWAVAAAVAMLLGWGRHAPFYRLVYALPYFSTIRNPMKFFHALHLCLMVLFAYGLLGLNRRFLDIPTKAASLLEQLGTWWSKPSPEKRWTLASIAVVVATGVAWFGYIGSRTSLVKYLQANGIPDQTTAAEIARFSAHEVLLFVVVLAVSVAIVTFIVSGAFAGTRAKWATVLMGLVLVIDLGRADAPWIIYYNWKDKYASNPIIDILRDHPYEHRVTMPDFQLNQQFGFLQSYYHVEWLQHHFPFYGVQSIDMPQDPRPPVDKTAFKQAVKTFGRLWELTNTRYQFGLAGQFADALNAQIDPVQKRFRQHTAFALARRENTEYATALTNTTGPFALIEFTGALPRVKLYNNWEIISDDKALLARIGDTNWNPHQTVLISDANAAKPPAPGATTGKAEIAATPSPKLMEIETTADTPAMLLLNDKIEPEWHAYIDGKQVPVLRANFLMRAVHVPAGAHKVTFRFEMKPTGFLLVLGCEILGLALLVTVASSARRRRTLPAKAAAA